MGDRRQTWGDEGGGKAQVWGLGFRGIGPCLWGAGMRKGWGSGEEAQEQESFCVMQMGGLQKASDHKC